MAQGVNVVVVYPALPVRTLAELQAHARQVPLTYASPGVGSTGHAAGAMIVQALGVAIEHIPYRGTGPALNDLVAGRVQMFTNALAPMQPQVQAGTLRAIAIAGRSRSAAMPDLPTTAEKGFPEIEAATWFGLLATGGTPADRVRRLHAALNATLAEPEVVRRLRDGGVEVEASASPEEFARFLAADRARWSSVVQRAGMRTE